MVYFLAMNQRRNIFLFSLVEVQCCSLDFKEDKIDKKENHSVSCQFTKADPIYCNHSEFRINVEQKIYSKINFIYIWGKIKYSKISILAAFSLVIHHFGDGYQVLQGLNFSGVWSDFRDHLSLY